MTFEELLSAKLKRPVALCSGIHGDYYVVYEEELRRQPIVGVVVQDRGPGVLIHDAVGALRLAFVLGVKVAAAAEENGQVRFTINNLKAQMRKPGAYIESNGGIYVCPGNEPQGTDRAPEAGDD